MARKQNLKVSIPLPAGVSVTTELQKKADEAVRNVVSELDEVTSLAEELKRRGFSISAGELLKSRTGAVAEKAPAKKRASKPASTSKPARKRKGKRVVLTDAQKKEIEDMLKNGSKARECAEKYGVSSATVNNIKRAAGLTQPTAAQKEAFAKRKEVAAS